MTKTQLRRSKLWLRWILLAVFILITFIAKNGYSEIEKSFFNTIYNLHLPNGLMLIITQFGAVGTVIGASLALLLNGKKQRALLIIIAGYFTYTSTLILKGFIARPRPYEVIDGVSSYDLSAFGYGFPSGHTALAVVIALSLWNLLGRVGKAFLLFMVVLVGFSRISLGVHAPLDILGGAILGAITYFMINALVKLVINKVEES
jgi:undecaprenyl-diphosphatase